MGAADPMGKWDARASNRSSADPTGRSVAPLLAGLSSFELPAASGERAEANCQEDHGLRFGYSRNSDVVEMQ